MTKRKDDTQQALADSLKVVRAAIRLRHSIAADRQLNDALPRVEKEFYRRVQAGELPSAATMLEAFDA